MAVRSTIAFLLNGEEVRLEGVDPSLTVLDWLREHRRLTGTKEGCREGDCGACTVVLVKLASGELDVLAVNACILFLPTIDGGALFTVEGVAQLGKLHPVQQEMVDCDGSQCGFCTPGFVMSLFAADLSGETPEPPRLDEILAGNLCRCTGYASIVRAANRALNASGSGNSRLAELKQRLEHLPREGQLELAHDCPRRGEFTYRAPQNLAQLGDAMAIMPDAIILAGGTDVGLWVTKQNRTLRHVIDVNRVVEMRHISEGSGHLTIGAGVTYSEARAILARRVPGFDPFLSRIASEQIRNSGTIGGNIANGSPIGDMPPVLIALNARIDLAGPNGVRTIPLENFFIEYGRQDRAADEVLVRIAIPSIAENAHFRVWKISKRFDQDISSVCGAFHLRLVGGLAREVRICFGGMAGTPKRAVRAEACLEGKSLSISSIDSAIESLAQDFSPLSDHRASSEYRMLVAQNLLRKFCAFVKGEAVVSIDREPVA